MKSSNYKLIKNAEREEKDRRERERERQIKEVKARSKRSRQNSGLQKKRQNCIVEYLCVWGEVLSHTE